MLTVVGVLGKLVTGWVPRPFRGNRLLIGVAMIPRGEVGLIFAQVGLAAGAIAGGEFGAIMLMVVVTTLITPPWLSAIVGVPAGTDRGDDSMGGLSELVSGMRDTVRRATRPVRRSGMDGPRKPGDRK